MNNSGVCKIRPAGHRGTKVLQLKKTVLNTRWILLGLSYPWW